ncbi:MAG: hypothetical protein AAFV86_07480 [Pseudomonadota bacterium]
MPDGLAPGRRVLAAGSASHRWPARATVAPGENALYWLAQSARQRVWRALAARAGPGPVVRVSAGDGSVEIAAAMPGLPGRPQPPGDAGRIAVLLAGLPMARDLAWAWRRGGAAAR